MLCTVSCFLALCVFTVYLNDSTASMHMLALIV
uniref:Uncharacterized protein n=1 Tax=Arundo donax TaxID=35708 RepID=A0A0A8Z3P0_ARUDO